MRFSGYFPRHCALSVLRNICARIETTGFSPYEWVVVFQEQGLEVRVANEEFSDFLGSASWNGELLVFCGSSLGGIQVSVRMYKASRSRSDRRYENHVCSVEFDGLDDISSNFFGDLCDGLGLELAYFPSDRKINESDVFSPELGGIDSGLRIPARYTYFGDEFNSILDFSRFDDLVFKTEMGLVLDLSTAVISAEDATVLLGSSFFKKRIFNEGGGVKQFGFMRGMIDLLFSNSPKQTNRKVIDFESFGRGKNKQADKDRRKRQDESGGT